MNQQTTNEIARLDNLRRVRGISKYRIGKDLGIPENTVGEFFRMNKIPNLENYLKMKQYLEPKTWVVLIPKSGEFSLVLPNDVRGIRIINDNEIGIVRDFDIPIQQYAGQKRKPQDLIAVQVASGGEKEEKIFEFKWVKIGHPNFEAYTHFEIFYESNSLVYHKR